jgi:hypothetical protein
MSDSTEPESASRETPEVVDHKPTDGEGSEPRNAISEPAKVMRIGSMIKQLLEEVRSTSMDEAGRNRLKDIYATSIDELGGALSSDLTDELNSLALPFGEDEVPSDSELRIAQAQLVGWLEGLFHGIQATLFAQQMAARQQLEQIQHQQALPEGGQPPRTGTYL